MTEDVRPTPTLDNPEEVRAALQNWLSEALNVDVTIPSLEVPENNGMSNVTLMIEAQLNYPSDQSPQEKSTEQKSYVVRVQPQGECLVFPEYDLALQCRVMELVAQHSDVNMPVIVAEDSSGDVLGMPFYIMGKTPGLIPPDIPPYHMDGWITEQNPESRARIWYAGVDSMARVNSIDITNPVVAEAIQHFDFAKDLSQQLRYWRDYYDWAYHWKGEKLQHEVAEQALQWLEDNQPEEQTVRLCWGDARMANVIFNGDMTDVAALLDWEMTTLGDPLQDVAWWIYMDELFCHGLGVEPLEGFPGREKTLEYWQSKTGLKTDQLDYYLVFAGLRFALLMGRMSIGMNNTDSINSRFTTCFEVQYLKKILEAAQQ